MNLQTPIDIITDPITSYIVAMYAILIIWESLLPARKLIEIRYWKLRGIAAFVFLFFLFSYIPVFINSAFEEYRFFDLSFAGMLTGTLIGVLLYELGAYFWHRQLHRSEFLWKAFHRMHHSSKRIDTFDAFFFSPLYMTGWTVLSSVCFLLILGLNAHAITATLLITNFLSIFQHANIHTPRWLGYVLQRPESHMVHYAKNNNCSNYSNLPLFDILFGTFINPPTHTQGSRYYTGASYRTREMFLGKDVSRPRTFIKDIQIQNMMDLS
jgi:sterol desaturase/sphingolipid hydroxylase (fatty acid hydroxylase superfamily)